MSVITVNGNLQRVSGTSFLATFEVDGRRFEFSCNHSVSLPLYETDAVKLSFVDKNLLTGSSTLSGTFGPSTFVYALNGGTPDGAAIFGNIRQITAVFNVTGDGTWASGA